jgi:ParB family chromosome partitioning protein
LHTDAKVAEEYELTRDKISKFCRYATLYRPLLLMMDQEKRLGQLAAYEISFIEDQCLQELLYQILNESKPPLSKAKAVQLRREFEKGTLDADRLRHLMENQPPSRAADTISVSVKLSPAYRQYFPEGTPAKQIEATVQKALELYFRSLPQTS